MNSEEISELLKDYKLTGPHEISDFSCSPGSEDSWSHIQLDLDAAKSLAVLPKNETMPVDTFVQNLNQLEYKLDVSFEPQAKPVTKSPAWTFSEFLKRLYVNIGQPCPIRIRSDPELQPGFVLRAYLRYTKADYANDAVTQCANHSAQENNSSLRGHLLRSKRIGAVHEKDERSGRHSVLISFDTIQDGADKDVFVFEFKCLNTCFGRRTVELVFQVEYEGKILCFHVVSVRICTCPGRDRERDEAVERDCGSGGKKIKLEKKSKSYYTALKRRVTAVDDEVFTIRVKGRKNYELLEELRQKLEKADEYDKRMAADGGMSSDLDAFHALEKKQSKLHGKILSLSQSSMRSQSSSQSSTGDRPRHYRISHHHHQQLQQSTTTRLVIGKIVRNKQLIDS